MQSEISQIQILCWVPGDPEVPGDIGHPAGPLMSNREVMLVTGARTEACLTEWHNRGKLRRRTEIMGDRRYRTTDVMKFIDRLK